MDTAEYPVEQEQSSGTTALHLSECDGDQGDLLRPSEDSEDALCEKSGLATELPTDVTELPDDDTATWDAPPAPPSLPPPAMPTPPQQQDLPLPSSLQAWATDITSPAPFTPDVLALETMPGWTPPPAAAIATPFFAEPKDSSAGLSEAALWLMKPRLASTSPPFVPAPAAAWALPWSTSAAVKPSDDVPALGSTEAYGNGIGLPYSVDEEALAMECPQCGADYAEDALFCRKCGSKRPKATQTQPWLNRVGPLVVPGIGLEANKNASVDDIVAAAAASTAVVGSSLACQAEPPWILQNGTSKRKSQATQRRDRAANAGSESTSFRRNKWINRQVTRAADSGDMHKLLKSVQQHLNEMNCINMATALHRLAKLAVTGKCGVTVAQLLKHDTFIQLRTATQVLVEQQRNAMMETAEEKAVQQQQLQLMGKKVKKPSFEVQCLSIVCWSCATLRYRESNLMPYIADVVMNQLHELKPFELSNMIWAYAKLNMTRTPIFEAVSARMAQRSRGSFGLQCLSMIVWSFATVKCQDVVLFSDIASEIIETASLTKPQEVANTVWAYAKTRCMALNLFDKLAHTAITDDMLWQFKPQELANTLWAFATVGHKHERLFSKASVVAINKRFQLSPQNIANILWAYAKLGSSQRSVLFPALLGVSVGMMPKHKPKEISAIAWASARENNNYQKYMESGADARLASNRLHEFPPRALASMTEAFAYAEDGDEFNDTLVNESLERLHQFGPTALANLFRGVVLAARRVRSTGTELGDREKRMLKSIGSYISWQVENFCDTDLEHVAHSLHILGPNLQDLTGGLNMVMLLKDSRLAAEVLKTEANSPDLEALGARLLGDLAPDMDDDEVQPAGLWDSSSQDAHYHYGMGYPTSGDHAASSASGRAWQGSGHAESDAANWHLDMAGDATERGSDAVWHSEMGGGTADWSYVAR